MTRGKVSPPTDNSHARDHTLENWRRERSVRTSLGTDTVDMARAPVGGHQDKYIADEGHYKRRARSVAIVKAAFIPPKAPNDR